MTGQSASGSAVPTQLAVHACAKINLFLRVTGRRADGYHELDSVFLPVSVVDGVSVEMRATETAGVALECDVMELSHGRNLAARAAHHFLDEFGVKAQVLIELEKHIPAGAGLGGGSSDAGAVLRMMAQMAGIDAPDRLRKIATALGADIPYFLDPRPARVRGIGEIIEPMDAIPHLPIVIAVPPFEVSTSEIFKALPEHDWSGPAPDRDLAAISCGEISQAILVNDLAAVAIEKFPEIGRLKSMLQDYGARAAQMSGSGGAVFGVFASDTEAEEAAAKLSQRARFAAVTAASTLDAAAAGGG
ncbi:MAG TPA: 4-(cytidine 5'-diphospho)-2-C-methyl-D-erythritol kinase [Candidatus Binataceae bacterium]|nr:4-(cytidine 5'-diphospho)-2-C-methyl-D-erythritol kinase [Candidatus Binataceae bacterium]